MVEYFFSAGLCHKVCFLPSLSSSHPFSERCFNSSRASYGDQFSFEILPGRLGGFNFQHFSKGDCEGIQQFLFRSLLAVDPGNLFNPSDPPLPIPADRGRIRGFFLHGDSPCLFNADTKPAKQSCLNPTLHGGPKPLLIYQMKRKPHRKDLCESPLPRYGSLPSPSPKNAAILPSDLGMSTSHWRFEPPPVWGSNTAFGNPMSGLSAGRGS